MKLFNRSYEKPPRPTKWLIKYKKFRNRHLWNAPGLRHSLFDAPLPQPVRTPESSDIPEELIDRIIESYKSQNPDDISKYPQFDFHLPLKEALDNADKASVTRQFQALFKGMLVASMGHHESYYFGADNWCEGYQELKVTDLLLNLAEALGILPVPNHAQMKTTDYVDLVHTDQEKLFSAIEKTLGFSLEMPLVGGPPIFQFGATKTNADMIRHGYLAYKMRQMQNVNAGAVLEIGAGFGSLALLSMRAGINNYIIIDLPVVNAIQTFFLGMALGTGAVSGLNEKRASVHILPPQAFDEIADGSVDLCVNIDSFPEMERDVLKGYLTQIKRISGTLLSVNQEAEALSPYFNKPQQIVREVIGEVGGFKRLYRYPYWMIEGYVEELYHTG